MGIEPFLVASAVRLSLAQRLVRRICEECKEPYTPSKELLDSLNAWDIVGEEPVFYRGRGCKRCNTIGYYGRVGIYEVFEVKPELRDLILQYNSPGLIKNKAVELGMATLYQSGMKKVLRGLTTIEEVLRITTEED